MDLFADFNGVPEDDAKTEFYQHDANWTNRMILGDSPCRSWRRWPSARGCAAKVQCIYIDPPYGIKFNSNFQWSTTSRDVKDGKATTSPASLSKSRPSRHLARRDSLLPDISARSADRGARSTPRIWLCLREEQIGDEGTTAYLAEQWGRRWITIDTSRVALALARARIMGARYPYYLLADSKDGQIKEAEVTGEPLSTTLTQNDISHGFVYERVPHITLKSIANNSEIDVIWENYQGDLEEYRKQLNSDLGKNWEEWEIPREAEDDWSKKAKEAHQLWREKRTERQREIDQSIAQKADQEFLYDKPYVDNSKVRVAGPFTVESLSPHRVLAVDEKDQPIETFNRIKDGPGIGRPKADDFTQVMLENLKTSGVQQSKKEDRIEFNSITGWPGGSYVCAEATYTEKESGKERRAGIFIGPEFGTVSRADLVAATRECGDAGFDVLIACAFSYDAHSAEFEKLGKIPVLKARMNADLHMADDLKNTGKGNLFVIFGEPEIEIKKADDNQIQVHLKGVDIFKPSSGEVVSSGPDDIACWFIDTNYNEESFFVRQAYFLGQNDPYKALKTTLKAEIDEEAWASLKSEISRPFKKPETGRIAVKVINHLGDEAMKVFSV
jgi:adenine-specific DNA-methyltransferase